MSPSSVSPQTKETPTAIFANRTSCGGSACPAQFSPQQVAVRSARIAHTFSLLAVTATKSPLGPRRIDPVGFPTQASRPSLSTPQVMSSPTPTWRQFPSGSGVANVPQQDTDPPPSATAQVSVEPTSSDSNGPWSGSGQP